MKTMATVHTAGVTTVRLPHDEQLHVHAPGCADLNKRLYKGGDPLNEDFANEQEMVESYYDNHINEAPGSTWQDYRTEFKVFPCVKWGA